MMRVRGRLAEKGDWTADAAEIEEGKGREPGEAVFMRLREGGKRLGSGPPAEPAAWPAIGAIHPFT